MIRKYAYSAQIGVSTLPRRGKIRINGFILHDAKATGVTVHQAALADARRGLLDGTHVLTIAVIEHKKLMKPLYRNRSKVT